MSLDESAQIIASDAWQRQMTTGRRSTGSNVLLFLAGTAGRGVIAWSGRLLFSHMGTRIFGPYPSGFLVGILRVLGLLVVAASTGIAIGFKFVRGLRAVGIGILLIAVPYILTSAHLSNFLQTAILESYISKIWGIERCRDEQLSGGSLPEGDSQIAPEGG